MNVIVENFPTNVTVAVGGISGPIGPQGNSVIATGINENTGNFVSTTGFQIVSGLKNFISGLALSYISGNSNYQGIVNNQGNVVVDWNNLTLSGRWAIYTIIDFPSTNIESISPSNRSVHNSVGLEAINWREYWMFDTAHITSVDWSGRVLYDNNSNISLDWQNRILSGNWNIQNAITTGNIIAGTNISISSSGNYTIVNYIGPQILYGSGNPNGIITGSTGWLYSDIYGHQIYQKCSGTNTVTGWF